MEEEECALFATSTSAAAGPLPTQLAAVAALIDEEEAAPAPRAAKRKRASLGEAQASSTHPEHTWRADPSATCSRLHWRSPDSRQPRQQLRRRLQRWLRVSDRLHAGNVSAPATAGLRSAEL